MLAAQHQEWGFFSAATMMFNERKVFSFHQWVCTGLSVSPSE